jgi:NADH-quinone oxidoreductase subunit L
MFFLILRFPLIGFLGSSFFGRLFGRGVSFITFFYIFSLFFNNQISILTLTPWLICEGLKISWELHFDTLTLSMVYIVTCIYTFVHFYAISYMEEDPRLQRFMSYLSLFTSFMLILVTADNSYTALK